MATNAPPADDAGDPPVPTYEQWLADPTNAEFTRKLRNEAASYRVRANHTESELGKKLKERWQTKDENHRRARNFIYGAWPNYRTSAEMKVHMEEARKAFETCRAAGDQLSPVKLLKANIAHTDQLNKEREGLEPEKNEDDRAKLQIIADLYDDLKKLTEGINAFLNESK